MLFLCPEVSDEEPLDQELASASEESGSSSDSSSSSSSSEDEDMDEQDAEPSTSTDQQRPKTPPADEEVRVFKIPKRKRLEETAPTKHVSPLNRAYPNMVYGNDKANSSGYRRRRSYRARKGRDPFYSQKFRRNGHGDGYSRGKCQPQLKLRSDDIALKHSMLRMQVPNSLIRPPGGRPFGQWLMPEVEECVKFISVTSIESKLKPERFTDTLVRRCTEWGMISSSLQDKSIVCDHIVSHFHSMQNFAQNTLNKEIWNCMRKETIMTTGLVTLCAFADEMMFWLQVNMDYGVQWKLCRDDAIMSMAPNMCTQALFKLRDMVSCFLEEKHKQAIVKQVCYLICLGDRLKEAASLLQELRFDFQFGLLVLLLVAPYAFLYSQSVPQCNFAPYFTKCVKEYKPGAVTGLLNSIVRDHHAKCKSRACSNNVTCLLAPGHSNQGLFFFPLPSKM